MDKEDYLRVVEFRKKEIEKHERILSNRGWGKDMESFNLRCKCELPDNGFQFNYLYEDDLKEEFKQANDAVDAMAYSLKPFIEENIKPISWPERYSLKDLEEQYNKMYMENIPIISKSQIGKYHVPIIEENRKEMKEEIEYYTVICQSKEELEHIDELLKVYGYSGQGSVLHYKNMFNNGTKFNAYIQFKDNYECGDHKDYNGFTNKVPYNKFINEIYPSNRLMGRNKNGAVSPVITI